MPFAYTIRDNFAAQWRRGQALQSEFAASDPHLRSGSPWIVHGDPLLELLDEHDLVCYFIYTLSSWWEIPLIDRVNAGRLDNSFAVIMDINPAPETYFRLGTTARGTPRLRYTTGLMEMFPDIEPDSATAMYDRLRNGFSHNLFGREPGRIRFDDGYDCPPILDSDDVLLVPPVKLAVSMLRAFVPKIAMLFVDPSHDYLRAFKLYMTGHSQF